MTTYLARPIAQHWRDLLQSMDDHRIHGVSPRRGRTRPESDYAIKTRHEIARRSARLSKLASRA